MSTLDDRPFIDIVPPRLSTLRAAARRPMESPWWATVIDEEPAGFATRPATPSRHLGAAVAGPGAVVSAAPDWAAAPADALLEATVVELRLRPPDRDRAPETSAGAGPLGRGTTVDARPHPAGWGETGSPPARPGATIEARPYPVGAATAADARLHLAGPGTALVHPMAEPPIGVASRPAAEGPPRWPAVAPPLPGSPGAGPLTPFLLDPDVTDVLVNGDSVWVDRGHGLVRTDVTFRDPREVRRLAQRLASACGRRLDEGSPYVDARLPDGTRLHAVLPPVATTGPYLSLRTVRRRAFTVGDLVARGTLTAAGADLLAAIVEARLSYLVSGGTGTGKTTLLATLLGLVPTHERIVIVEDAAELSPDHPHAVTLQARTANVEGSGAVSLRDLVREALRMRPDRLVVGECRGAEVIDLLGALNTGHEGSAGTLHANAATDVPARLEALGLLSGVPRAAVHAQVAAALRVVVHLRRVGSERVVDEIVLLRARETDGVVIAVPAWHRLGGVRPGAIAMADLLTERGVRAPAALLGAGG